MRISQNELRDKTWETPRSLGKREREIPHATKEREMFASFSDIGVASRRYAAREMGDGAGVKGWKGGANHNRLSFVFSAFCFYAFLALTVAICSSHYDCAPRLGTELARFLFFTPLSFGMLTSWMPRRRMPRQDGSTGITNACARWMLFSMMKEVLGGAWGFATIMSVTLLIKIYFDKKDDWQKY